MERLLECIPECELRPTLRERLIVFWLALVNLANEPEAVPSPR
jgi:hypothetical protein